MKVDESDIIAGLQKGEEKAYEYVFQTYYPLMRHVAANFLSDDFTAETVVSDVISHLFERREAIDIRYSLRSFLLTSVRNASINYLGTRVQRMEAPFCTISDGKVSSFNSIGHTHDPLGRLLEDELENEIEDAINSLPETTSRVFRKSRFEGKSYKEIAEEEGVTINSIQYHIKRSLMILHETLGKRLR
ncbi:MAG: RNA polymerase sigma-70 factor [Bacteroidaceae bacterium]|nr:RNA polymerase sigma-70 factor [Bacteroidaceae bacterium]MBR1789868.1 RNA polymerase sigma-70 factor [Bacteroidaceae bacterium]